jgi:hypothetical protein
MTGGPFAVDVEAALDALDLAWGDEYDGKRNAQRLTRSDALDDPTQPWPLLGASYPIRSNTENTHEHAFRGYGGKTYE